MSPELVEITGKVGLASLLGGLVGAEREWTGKWAGLRTHMLIAVGAALLTDVSIQIGMAHSSGSTAWDPGRIAAQVVSGVGFLGAGTIIQARGSVHGLTTAASLWVAAAIGLAVGASFYVEAAVTTVVLLLILRALKPLERRFLGHVRSQVLELAPEAGLPDLARLLEGTEVEVEGLTVNRDGERRTVILRYRASDEAEAALLRCLQEADLFEPVDSG